jgi:UDP-glucose 4-epimerase
MKILVVGGAGYIGSHVCKKLIKAGHQVRIFDNLSSGLKENISPSAEFILGDILNPEQLATALIDCEAVIHLAAFKAAGESMVKPEKYSINNLVGTINLLNACTAAGITKLIFSSSAAVYGEPQYLPIDERHPTEPINYYGFTKLEIEHLLKWYDQLKGLKFAALRYFNAVGYDSDGELKGLEKNPANLLPIVMETAGGTRPYLEIFGDDYDTKDGTCLRDYIHVDDLAEGHLKALQYLIDKNESLIANLGTSQGLSVKEIVAEAEKQLGRAIPVKIGPRRPGDPAQLYADSRLANELLDWQPQFSTLENIVKTTINAYNLK